MEIYADIDNDSNVARYEIDADFIVIEFKSGKEVFYKYTYASAGRTHVEEMKKLARCGDGLNAYIILNKVPYESKW